MAAVLIALYIPFFVVIWLVALAVAAKLGGWGELAQRYEAPVASAPERRRRFQTVVLRRPLRLPARYRGIVNVGIGADGLHLVPIVPFRFQHQPLLIPWRAITRCEDGSLLGFHWVDVEVADATPTLRFRGRMGEEIEEEWRRWGHEGADRP